MKAFIVFNCPVGSATWTIAHKDNSVPAYFIKRDQAESFVSNTMSLRKAWMDGKPDQVNWDTFIAEIDLPEREAERISVKAAYESRND